MKPQLHVAASMSVFEKLNFFEISLTYMNYYENRDTGKKCEIGDT